MKGVVDIEFFLALVIFVVVISFVSLLVIGNLPILRSEALSNDLKSRAYQASYQLVFYEGMNEDATSSDWTWDDVSQLGISSGRYTLSQLKIDELQKLCNNDYPRLNGLLAQGFRHAVILNITTQAWSWECSPQIVSEISSVFRVTRLSTLNGDPAKITLSVI